MMAKISTLLAFALLLQSVGFAQESAAGSKLISNSTQIPDSPGAVQARLVRAQIPQTQYAQAQNPDTKDPREPLQTAPSADTTSAQPEQSPSQSLARSNDTSMPENAQSAPAKPQTDVPDMPPAPDSKAGDGNTQSSGSEAAIITQPLGTAVAQPLQTTGVAASRPAGAAVAPARQHRVRTILIRVGALVGAGAALGTTMALSQASPSRPPGVR